MTQVDTYEPLFQEDINVGVDVGTKKNPGGGNLVGTQVGIHSFAVGQAKVTQLWDPPEIISLEIAETTVPVIGASIGDFPQASFSLPLQGIQIYAEVTAANVVTVRFFNPTKSVVDLEEGTVSVLVLKSR